MSGTTRFGHEPRNSEQFPNYSSPLASPAGLVAMNRKVARRAYGECGGTRSDSLLSSRRLRAHRNIPDTLVPGPKRYARDWVSALHQPWRTAGAKAATDHPNRHILYSFNSLASLSNLERNFAGSLSKSFLQSAQQIFISRPA